MAKNIWRTVNGLAIDCTRCPANVRLGDGTDTCTANNEVCIFMNDKIDSQKTWDNFHDACREMAEMRDEHTEDAE